jgi:predicted PurR-regulated permease PerM
MAQPSGDISPHSSDPTRRERTIVTDWGALRWAVGALAAGAFVALLPLLAPLMLAAWAAVIARPACRWLSKKIHHRSRAAALITVLLVLIILTPLVIAALSLSAAAVDLGRHLAQSKTGLVLGPLLVRLASEGLTMLKERAA